MEADPGLCRTFTDTVVFLSRLERGWGRDEVEVEKEEVVECIMRRLTRMW